MIICDLLAFGDLGISRPAGSPADAKGHFLKFQSLTAGHSSVSEFVAARNSPCFFLIAIFLQQ